jgi:hypothetical protein
MKIVNRKEFLKLPRGTFFQLGKPFVFFGIQMKGYTVGDDFYYLDFGICHKDCYEPVEDMEYYLRTSNSYSMNHAEVIDGMFDEDAIFMIYEK